MCGSKPSRLADATRGCYQPDATGGGSVPGQGTEKMSDPVVARKAPFQTEVKAGKTYFWCACGRSANQPFCDGSHKGTEFSPLRHEATEDGKLYFCGCKRTGNAPLCDGSHKSL